MNTQYIGKKLSFWQLVTRENYFIEVPILQRDYVHGRKSAYHVREKFIKDIFETLTLNQQPMTLDFVYGSVHKSSNGVSKFVPLDGQQRLTTLFLLHWYLAHRDDDYDVFQNIFLNGNNIRFTYETRITSKDFLKKLIGYQMQLTDSSDVKPSDLITNENWFLFSWHNDPTIQSMLVMLDTIHQKFYSTSGLFGLLIANEEEHEAPITFQFVKLEEYGLTESLYIKMNARGLDLTPFENFKAQFIKLLGYADINAKKNFSDKIDTLWADLFWSYRDEKSQVYDNQIMNFIRVLITQYYAIKEGASENKITVENLEKLIKADKQQPQLNFYEYEKMNCLGGSVLVNIAHTFELLNDNQNRQQLKTYLSSKKVYDETTLFEKCIENNLDYPERVQVYAYFHYLITHDYNDNFNDWMRVIRNLAENTRIDSPELFLNAINAADKLLNDVGISNVLDYLTSNNVSGLKFFLKTQQDEEVLKAHLIKKSERWRLAIESLENQGYFKGQIGFVLGFSDVQDKFNEKLHTNWDVNTDDNLYNAFSEYSNKAKVIFNKTGLAIRKNHLIERALLSIGNYLLNKGVNYSFLVDNDRDIGWRRLLRDDNEERKYFKTLLDSINPDTVENDLQNIIDNSQADDWRKFFIEIDGLIDKCGTNRFIRADTDDDILLLEKTQTNGMHREYYTYALCLYLRYGGNKQIDAANYVNQVEYESANSVDDWKYIKKINGRKVVVKYDNIAESKNYLVEGRGKKESFDSMRKVTKYLKSENLIN